MSKNLNKRVLIKPKTLKKATIQYRKELPLTINFNVKEPVGFVALEKSVDDYLINPLAVYKEHHADFNTLQPVVAGKILESKEGEITKFQILAINLTLKN